MKTSLPNKTLIFGMLIAAFLISPFTQAQEPTPELVFINPVLVSGTANSQDAIYRFPNVIPGIDAEVKLKKFSRPDIVMSNIDNNTFGWNKAFQPQFGLAGLVLPYQNWYIDFEMTFFVSGTNNKKKVKKFDITSLDVDGDGNSISEYITVEKPSKISYSTVTYLKDGIDLDVDDEDGTTGSNINGPVENFLNIDTNATQVMATYTYLDKDAFKFRIGAKSSSLSSNGSGVRLNSMWFRSFSLAPLGTLPVKLIGFTAAYDKTNVTLNWTTAQEENFSHFVIERSSDGKSFSEIATLFSAGGNGNNNYMYKDKNVNSPNDIYYYRIKCVDKTRETSLSSVRVIKLSKNNLSELLLSTYPNPVADQLKVTLPTVWQNKTVLMEVFNTQGICVQTIKHNSASQTEIIELGNLNKGMYIVKASCDKETVHQQIIKN